MSRWSAWFFDQVQRADFYRRVHAQAVDLLPPAQPGQRWLDLGCGPGLVAGLAHARGYEAWGLDLDAAMVAQARQRWQPDAAVRTLEAQAGAPAPRFEVAGLSPTLRERFGTAQVVSAASLLRVLPDRAAALAQLCDLVAPGGQLLVVETSPLMAQGVADPADPEATRAHGRGAWALPLWAWTRRNRPAVDVPALQPPGWQVQQHAGLLGGWVDAWVLTRT